MRLLCGILVLGLAIARPPASSLPPAPRSRGGAPRGAVASPRGAVASTRAVVASPRAVVARLRGGMTPRAAWGVLFAATASELVSCVFMHRAEGFSRPGPSCVAVFFYALSFGGFNLSLRALEISVAYAVWSAVVMAGLALIGMTCLGEVVSVAKALGIAAIVAGTAVLSLAGVSS